MRPDLEWTLRDTRQLSPHFLIGELACRCGCAVPRELRPALVRLALTMLEPLRAAIGRALVVQSGYRCEARNAMISRAAKNSQHLCGTAADVRARGLDGEALRAIIERCIRDGEMPDGGVGTYLDPDRAAICHVDVRGHRARWRD